MALPLVKPVVLVAPRKDEFNILLTKLTSSNKWAVEKKLDGHRCMVVLDQNGVRLLNKQGENYTKLPKGTAEWLHKFLTAKGFRTVILDLEIMGYQNGETNRYFVVKHEAKRVLFAFDLLWVNGKDLRREPYYKRKKALKTLLGLLDPEEKVFRYVSYVSDPFEKAEFVGNQWWTDSEGVVFKHIMGKYPDIFPWWKFKNNTYSKK